VWGGAGLVLIGQTRAGLVPGPSCFSGTVGTEKAG